MSLALVMCEGRCEQNLLNVLLKRNLLMWKEDDLLMGRVRHLRQIDEATAMRIMDARSPIDIYRVGDKLSDALKRTAGNKMAMEAIQSVAKVLTRPEFEVLFLLREHKYESYLKWRKGRNPNKPSDFYKTIHGDYRKDQKYIEDYLRGMDDREIVSMLKEYREKRFGAHEKDELCLYDLLREDLKK